MSQPRRLVRARQLTASVLPGRRADADQDLVVARLRKIAAAGGTGILPIAGPGDGAIHFRYGKVIYAESSRVPAPRPPAEPAAPSSAAAPPVAASSAAPSSAAPSSAAPSSAAPSSAAAPPVAASSAAPSSAAAPPAAPLPAATPSAAAPPGDLSPLGRVAAALAVAEPTVDAALDLLSGGGRCSRFRSARVPESSRAAGVPLEALMTEVTRRQRLLRQFSAVLTPDTAVARYPYLRSESIRVSAGQWALLIRVQAGATPSTPRELAWQLSRSVFATTVEIYRLVTLGLLSVAGQPAAELSRTAMSFIQAVSVDAGSPGAGVTAVGGTDR